MDITKTDRKIFATKIINVETVNFTACTFFSFFIFLALKQFLKICFDVSAPTTVLISFGISTVLSYFLEKHFVFPKGISGTAKQLIMLVFRMAVNVGFYKLSDFLFGNILSLQSSFVFTVSFSIIFFFNYYFDRLLLFDCLDKAETKSGGRFYRCFFRNRFVVASMITAALCIAFLYIIYSLFPFGDTTVMRMDLYHQYGPLFAELYDRVIDFKGFFYSWESGGGSSFLGNYFNYLSSPFSFLIFLFDKKDISFAITMLVALKGILSAGTFTFYLKKSQNRHSFATAAFGVFYAFCAYFLAYYWNIMWIDGMIFLPLIVLGIENIVKNGKCKLYIISLCLLLFSSYYIGYMVCIFSALYFVVCFLLNWKLNGPIDNSLVYSNKRSLKALSNNAVVNRGLKFVSSSLLCGAICAITLIPIFFILRSCSATSDTFPSTFDSYFDIFDFLTSHLASLETTIRSSGDHVLPNVYCGILTIILVPLYLINKDIRLKEKALYIFLLLFFLFSFNNNIMNFIWHAFHFPNDLPYRFSFIYVFILLIVAFRGLMHIKSIRYKDIVYIGMLWLFYIIIAQKLPTTKMSESGIYISVAFVIVWSGVLLLIKKGNLQKVLLSFIMLAMTFCEVIVADSNSMLFTQSNADYSIKYDTYTEAIDYLDKNDDSFYRTELTYLVTRMDPCYYGYNGISTFSSMAYENYSGLQYSLGLFGNRINSYTYNPQTPVYDMMFGIKYLIANEDTPTPSKEYYKQLFETEDLQTTIYENNYALPIAYCVNSKTKEWITEEGDPFEIQGNYFELATGFSDVFIPCKYLSTSFDNLSGDSFSTNGTIWFNKFDDTDYGYINVDITPEKSGNVYVYVTSSDVKTVDFSSENMDTRNQSIEEPYIIDLGFHEKGDEISVSIDGGSIESDDGYVTMYAYSVDNDVFTSGYNALKAHSLNVTNHSDTKINGTVFADENCYLYTSIPYDSGWSVYVDGEKTKTFKIGGSLLGAAIKPGEHEIVLKYTPQGMLYGIVISGTAVIGIAGYCIIKAVKKSKKCRI